MTVYVAPVYIAVEAPEDAKAAEAVSYALRHLMIEDGILDWGYASAGTGYRFPRPVDLTVERAASEEANLETAYLRAAPTPDEVREARRTDGADYRGFFTIVGYADMDDGVETFTETVYASCADAWMVAVAQAMPDSSSRQFLRQATEISTFEGVCICAHGGAPAIPMTTEPASLPVDPDMDRLDDMSAFRRTGEAEGFYYYDDDQEEGIGPFPTYVECLSARYEAACGE